MEASSQHDDLIDRYIQQDLTPDERKSFEEILRQDEDLQEEVDLHQDIISGVGLSGAESLKRQLQESEDQEISIVPASSKPKSRPIYTWLAVAASVTALLLVAIFLFNTSGSNSQELYAAYYEPYPNVVNPVERSEGVPTDAAGLAMYYYEQGNFEDAIKLFTQEPGFNDFAYQFYLGVSYLGAQEPELAEQTLEPLLEDEDGAFYEPALWYTGLAQLRKDQLPAARKTMKKIETLQGEYSADAQKLLEEL